MAESTKKELKKLPPLTLSLIIVSFLLVFLGILFILLPQYQTVQKIKKDRISKIILLEEQKKIFPLYAQAAAMADHKFDPMLPLADRKALDRKKIISLSKVFTDIAILHQMVLVQHNLDVESFKNQSDSISMDVIFNGNFFDYRNCLISFAKLPFFNRIERINISTDKSNVKKFTTKILLNINKK